MGLPSLKKIKAGILRTPYFIAMAGLLSTSSLATLSLPVYSTARSCTAGAIILQGPHHSAQKSTKTGSSELITSWSQVLSVTSLGSAILSSKENSLSSYLVAHSTNQ